MGTESMGPVRAPESDRSKRKNSYSSFSKSATAPLQSHNTFESQIYPSLMPFAESRFIQRKRREGLPLLTKSRSGSQRPDVDEIQKEDEASELQADAFADTFVKDRDPVKGSELFTANSNHTTENSVEIGNTQEAKTTFDTTPATTIQRSPAASDGSRGIELDANKNETVKEVLKEPGEPLPDERQERFEEKLGRELPPIRIHTGASAEESTRSINARAYTVGNHIVFGANQYHPGTKEGDHLLAHEVAHVAQNSAGREATVSRKIKRKERGPSEEKTQSWVEWGQEKLQQGGAYLSEKAIQGIIWTIERVPDVFFLPLIPLGNLFRAGALGFFKRMASEGGEKLSGLLSNFVNAIISKSFIVSFLKGVAKGFFVDGIWGTMKLLWDLVTLPKKMYDFVVSVYQYLGDVDISGPLKQIGQAFIETGKWISSNGYDLVLKIVTGARNANLDTVKESFEGLYGKAKSKAGQIGDSIAELLVKYFSQDPNKVGEQLGSLLGNTTGGIAFDALISAVTAGGGAAISAGKKAIVPLRTWLSSKGEKALHVAKSVWNNVKEVTGAIGITIAKWSDKLSPEPGKRVNKLVEKVEEFFSKLMERVKQGPRKKKGPDLDDTFDPELAKQKGLELEKAKVVAKGITKSHETVKSPVSVLLGSLNVLKKQYRWIKGFRAEPKGNAGHYKIDMLASEHTIDDDYSTEPQKAIDNDLDGVEKSVESGLSRITAASPKEFKALVQTLSKPGNPLTKAELKELEVLTNKFGGRLRYDLNPVKGKIRAPHVQVEGLGNSIQSRHIWIEPLG